jgi:hypothetical protein
MSASTLVSKYAIRWRVTSAGRKRPAILKAAPGELDAALAKFLVQRTLQRLESKRLAQQNKQRKREEKLRKEEEKRRKTLPAQRRTAKREQPRSRRRREHQPTEKPFNQIRIRR